MAATAHYNCKIVCVGGTEDLSAERSVGKTCLLRKLAGEHRSDAYVPTVFDNYATKMKIDGHEVHLTLLDTPSKEDYDRLRPLSYPSADLVLMCYSPTNPKSFRAVYGKWLPEVRHYLPSIPILLVATKMDLVTNEKEIANLTAEHEKVVSSAEGRNLAKELGFADFFEVSSVSDSEESINTLREYAVRYAEGKGRPVPPLKPALPSGPQVVISGQMLKDIANVWNRAESFPDLVILDHGEALLLHTVILRGIFPYWRSGIFQQKSLKEITSAIELEKYRKMFPSCQTSLRQIYEVLEQVPKNAVKNTLEAHYANANLRLPRDTNANQLLAKCFEEHTEKYVKPNRSYWETTYFQESLENKELSDVSFICPDAKNSPIFAHKTILMMRSERFAAMYSHEMKETKAKQLEVPDYTRAVFSQMLKYLYEDRVDQNFAELSELLRLANEYNLVHLVTQCEYFMAKKLSELTVYEYLNFAVTFNAKQLEANCLNWLYAHYNEIKKSKGFGEKLTEQTKKLIEENAWPGKQYTEKLAAWKIADAKWNSTHPSGCVLQ